MAKNNAAPAPTDTLLIVLEGQGDLDVKLVPAVAEEWLNKPPHFPDGVYSIQDPLPAALREEGGPETVCVTTGSWDNDRALMVPGQQFDSEADAREYAAKNGLAIVSEYYGCIY